MKSHLVKIPKEQPTGTVALAFETYYVLLLSWSQYFRVDDNNILKGEEHD